nr:glycerate kinase [Cellulomonas sp. RIT-PI-Y]
MVSPGRFDRPTTPAPGASADSGWAALGAPEVARAIADGWRDARPADRVELLPLNDGGPGLIDVLRAARGGELAAVTVPDAGGVPVPSAVLVLTEDSGSRTAYVDGSVALSGSAPVDRSSSAGLGELVRAAVDTGAERVVVGTGPRRVTAHDGGWGLLRALIGAGDLPERGLGAPLPSMADRIAALQEELRGRDLVLLGTHDLALLGLNGASAALVDAGRATAEESQAVERRMADLVATLTAAAGAGRVDLLATTHAHGHGRDDGHAHRPDSVAQVGAGAALGRPAAAASRTTTRPAVAPGSGAGGGAAFVLGLLGARRVDGAAWVADAVRLADRVESADLVVTGAGVLDAAALEEGVVPAVSGAALPLGVPLIALAAQVRTGRRDWGAAGVAGAFGVIEQPGQLADWQAGPAAALRARIPRIARTWSR